MKASMCFVSCSREVKEVPCSELACKLENQHSTWLSQEARVGVKWNFTRGCRTSHLSFLRCVLRLSRMTLSFPFGQADTTSSMKARNSLRRRRFLCATFTLPVATSQAANSVVVPCRL